MADFQGVKDEVEKLQAQYDELKIDVPRLESQKEGLEFGVEKLQSDVAKTEEIYEYLKEQNIKIAAQHEDKMAKRLKTVELVEKDFKKAIARDQDNIDRQNELLDQRMGEMMEQKSELDTLLEKQVEAEKDAMKQLEAFEKTVSTHSKEVAKFNKDKAEFKEMKKELESKYGESSIERIQASITAKGEKADEMTKEAESLMSKAQKALAEGKERITLVSLKEDEFQRKEKMLGAEIKRVEDKEKSLNDRAAVYKSHK